METLNSAGTVISDLMEQVKRLETKVIGLENHGKAESVPGFTEVDESSIAVDGEDTDQPTLNYLPKVRKCNFIEFKNRFSEEDSRYAVDVLVSGDLFEQEYMEEQRLRDRLFEHGKSDPGTAKRKAQALVKETNRSNNALRNDQSKRTWIRRIRLQAPALLQILARVQGESWSNRPRTYDRPFCTLIHFQPQVKKALAELEEKWSTHSEGHHRDAPVTPREIECEGVEQDFLDDSKATLAILRSYVEFIDA